MDSSIAVAVERVSKKYCRSLKHSMLYGLSDVSRNMVGLRANSGELRDKEFWAVDDVSLEVKRGETVGLIGPNGSGKTTLLKMIGGIFWPDRGQLSVRGKLGALIAVGAGFHPLLTGRENIYVNAAILGMNKKQIDRQFDSIVDFAQVGEFLETPVKNYSSGMFVRLGFAVAVHCDPDVMLVDEVLAVGDRGFQAKCFQKMSELRSIGTTFVVVSHNMHTISGFVDWVALLKRGKMTRYDDVSAAVRAYAQLFLEDKDDDIERLVDGGKSIAFSDVQIPKRTLAPGEDFVLQMKYAAVVDHDDVEIDVAIYDGRDPDLWFQATNRTYGTRVDLKKGQSTLTIRLRAIQMHGSMARVAVAIWAKDRLEHLFWWRVPFEMSGVPDSNGKNFIAADFEVGS
ncbi:MAG: ABC transporter ATP-binding protein [Polyangiaceae bacterium]